MPAEVLKSLSALDDRLIEVLRAEDVKLLHAAWVRMQPDSFRIQRRQDLEALQREVEGTGELVPFLSADEAVALVRKGVRGIGVASHGWLSAGDPDPAGERMRMLRGALKELPHIEAVFFDFPSLFQRARTAPQTEAFKRSLGVVRATPSFVHVAHAWSPTSSALVRCRWATSTPQWSARRCCR